MLEMIETYRPTPLVCYINLVTRRAGEGRGGGHLGKVEGWKLLIVLLSSLSVAVWLCGSLIIITRLSAVNATHRLAGLSGLQRQNNIERCQSQQDPVICSDMLCQFRATKNLNVNKAIVR